MDFRICCCYLDGCFLPSFLASPGQDRNGITESSESSLREGVLLVCPSWMDFVGHHKAADGLIRGVRIQQVSSQMPHSELQHWPSRFLLGPHHRFITTISTLHVLTSFTLTTALWDGCRDCPDFRDGVTETQRLSSFFRVTQPKPGLKSGQQAWKSMHLTIILHCLQKTSKFKLMTLYMLFIWSKSFSLYHDPLPLVNRPTQISLSPSRSTLSITPPSQKYSLFEGEMLLIFMNDYNFLLGSRYSVRCEERYTDMFHVFQKIYAVQYGSHSHM